MSRKLEVYYPEDSVVNIFAKPNKYLKDDYGRYFSNEMLGLATDKDLSGNDLRVFLAILANVGFENIFNLSQQELSDQLKIHRPAIAKSLKKLISKGYLQVIDTSGRKNTYMVNPHVILRSRAKNYKYLCRAWEQETIPNTKKSPIDIDSDLDLDLEDKLEDKVSELSQQFGVPKSKVKQIILSLVNQALDKESEKDSEIPY